jgi:hypothetical protein
MFGMLVGGLAFAALRGLRYRDFGAIGLAAVSVAALAGYNALAVNTNAFHNKFSFFFPSPDPWVEVTDSSGATRLLSGGWVLEGSDGNSFLQLELPRGGLQATLVASGRLEQGGLSFAKEDATRRRLPVQARVEHPGPFEVRIDVQREEVGGRIFIVGERMPLRATIESLRWTYTAPAAAFAPPGAAPAGGVTRVRNLAERFADWKRFGEGIFDSVDTFFFGHAAPLPREQRTSAHNFYIDFVYNFGALALLPLVGLILYTGRLLWRERRRVVASDSLLALAVVVAFLVFMENSLKVTLRQPYPGIAVYFLWGLLLSRLADKA